ncbi:uncharacterized protein [Canis lupus baileyi]|uniref:uncharacterized protein n=1 Tax=Canis lupus baileyi TaxID=143281 RepID=UPI003B96F708
MGGLTREARGSAPHAWGEKEWPAERRRQERRRGDPSRSARPLRRGRAALRPPPPPALGPSPPPAAPRPGTLRTPGPAADRALSLLLPPREERAHAHCHARAPTAEVELGPRRPPRKRGWLRVRSSPAGGRAGREALPGPPRPVEAPRRPPVPARFHAPTGREGRRPSPGHASSRGRRGAGPSGRARACSAPRRCPDSSPRRDGRHNLGGRREDLRGKGRTQRDCGPPWDLPPALAGPRGGRLAPTAGAGRGGATSRSCARPRDRSPPGPVCAETASIGCRARGRDSAFSDPLEGRATPAELDRFRHQEPDGRSPPLCARASPRNRILNQPIWNHLVSTYEQITNSTTYVGSSFLFLLKHGTVVRVLLPALRLTPATLLHPGSSPLAAAFHLYNRGEKTCSFSNILRICPIIPLRSTGTASQCLPLGPDLIEISQGKRWTELSPGKSCDGGDARS